MLVTRGKLPLPNDYLLRQGELAFAGAFHGIEPFNDLAFDYSRSVVWMATSKNGVVHPIAASELLADIGVLSHQNGEAELASVAADLSVGIAKRTTSAELLRLGLYGPQQTKAIAKGQRVLELLDSQASSRRRALLHTTSDTLRRVIDIVDNGDDEKARQEAAGQMGELALLKILTLGVPDTLFFPASQLLDRSVVCAQVGTQPYRLGFDVYAIHPDKPRAPTMIQTKTRNDDGNPYAPHILEITWRTVVAEAARNRSELSRPGVIPLLKEVTDADTLLNNPIFKLIIDAFNNFIPDMIVGKGDLRAQKTPRHITSETLGIVRRAP